MDNEMQSPKEVYEMMAAGTAEALEDIYKIENVAVDIQKMQDKIEFNDGLKKKRINEINDAVNVLENKINFYRSVIHKTMQAMKQKSVTFPGVCKISCRTPSPSWTIEDEDAFITFVKEKGEKDRVLEEVPVQTKIIKKEANKLLNDLEKAGDVPENIVTKKPVEESVSITFLNKEVEDDTVAIIKDDTIPMKKDMAQMQL
jgi:hypothetical protein